mmetsp:Transcript_3609/g.5390  ORF Transcript_3609/g.5390 Transcript_3609/m.5390 type:complete len:217 (+) Transcript_3609:2591-3241(+)
MISGTSFGLVMATIILPVICSISLFPITSQADFMAFVAAAFTCFLVSHIQAVTSGTISGRAFPSCLGAFLLKTEIQLRASSRRGHFFSTGSCAKRAGRRLFMPNGLMFSQMARAVAVAAVLIAAFLAPACSRIGVKHWILKASASIAPSDTAFTVAIAARASASSLDAHLATRALMLEAKPDFSTPSALMAATTEASSPSERLAILDSRDMFFIFC